MLFFIKISIYPFEVCLNNESETHVKCSDELKMFISIDIFSKTNFVDDFLKKIILESLQRKV